MTEDEYYDFLVENTDKSTEPLRTAVFIALGSASVSWHENGVFNPEFVTVVGNALVRWLDTRR